MEVPNTLDQLGIESPDLALVEANTEQPLPISDDQITVREISHYTLNPRHTGRFFEERGFESTPCLDRGRRANAFERGPLMAYVNSYLAAEPLPKERDEVTRVQSLVTDDTSLEEVFRGLIAANVPIRHFMLGAKLRGEFIPTDKVQAVRNAIEAARNPELEPEAVDEGQVELTPVEPVDPNAPKAMPERSKPTYATYVLGSSAMRQSAYLYTGDGANQAFVIEDIQAMLPAEVPPWAIISAIRKLKIVSGVGGLAEAQARSILRTVLDDAATRQATTTRGEEPWLRKEPATPESPWTPRYMRNLSPITDVQTEDLDIISEIYGQPLNTLVAIIAHHPGFEGAQVGLGANGQVVVDQLTWANLSLFFDKNSEGLQTIPENWQLLDDVAKDCNRILEGQGGLREWVDEGDYPSEHLINITVRSGGKDKLITFCSPHLARVIVDGAFAYDIREYETTRLASIYGTPALSN